jgi:putative dGTPase
MGNPPFGHSGERAISAYFKEGNGVRWRAEVEDEGGRWEDFLFFEGNANAFRLLTHQFEGRRAGGFALTYSTVASIVKYPYSSLLAGKKNKFGFFATEEDTMREVGDELGLIRLSDAPLSYVRHPLVYLVEAADDICYQIMDIEDACKLHILSFDEAETHLMAFFSDVDKAEIQQVSRTIGDANERLGYLRAKVINLLVEEVASIFLDEENAILDGHFHSTLIQHLSPRSRSAYEACSHTAYTRIYSAHDVVDVELAGHRIFSSLLDHLIEAQVHPEHSYSRTLLSRVSSQYDTSRPTLYGKIQCALDYISGMTDIYALNFYRTITGMNLPAV